MTTTLALDTVKTEALSLTQEAERLQVVDQASFELGGVILQLAHDYLKKVAILCDPVIHQAHKAHQETLKQKRLLEEPGNRARILVDGKVTAYRRAEEEKIRQAQLAAERERQRQEEEIRLAAALELEKQGNHKEAEIILTAPTPPEPVFTPPPQPAPKLEGVSFREYWSAEVTDFDALLQAVCERRAPSAAIEPSLPFLNAQARSLKGALNIPGVKAVCTSGTAVKA